MKNSKEMKYFNKWENFKKIKESLDLSDDNKKTLELIKSNSQVPLLSINSNSNTSYIKLIQDTLKLQGYQLDINGIFDDKTKEAVINYQSSTGLKKDGIIGKNTWKSLLELNDVNIEPKITNIKTTPVQKTEQAPINTTKQSTTNVTSSTAPIANDYVIKNTKNNDINFSKLKGASNIKELLNNGNSINLLIKNNKNNKRFILDLIKLFEENDGNLVSFILDRFDTQEDVLRDLLYVILHYVANPTLDAKILNYCVSGAGTYDDILEMVIEKRKNMPESYKKQILNAYKENYDATFSEDMVDDGVDEELIKKIDSEYFDTES